MQEEAEEAREQALIHFGETAQAQAAHRAFLHGGRREVLLRELEDLKSRSKTQYVSPYRFATVYADLGDKQEALNALEEAVRQHSPMILDVQNNFTFDGLHSEPRYRALVQRIGQHLR